MHKYAGFSTQADFRLTWLSFRILKFIMSVKKSIELSRLRLQKEMAVYLTVNESFDVER
jgi:hypothetical protein